MANTPNLPLPIMLGSQAQKHVTFNEAMLVLSALTQIGVIDRTNTPPGAPNEGDRYLVTSVATGEWAGHEDSITVYQNGAWEFYTPEEGWTAWANDEDTLYIYNGAAWVTFADGVGFVTTTQLEQGAVDLLGINGATADATNRFSINSSGALFNNDGDDMAITINKNAAADDGGFYFQTGFSTRAVFGLMGDDDFSVRVSPDGSTFFTGLSIDKDTGNVGIGTAGDANNRLVVSGESSLFTNSGDLRFTFSKGAVGDDASLTFQTNFSARALIGLLGDDDFTFKVTPDGNTFHTAMVIDKDNGSISFPQMALVAAHLNYDHYADTTYVNTDINIEDLDNMAAFASNVFTAPRTGFYKVGYTLGWTQNGTNLPTAMHGRILKNGTDEILPSASRTSNNANDSGKIIISVEGVISLAANDTIRLQHKFSTLDGYASADITTFWVQQITG